MKILESKMNVKLLLNSLAYVFKIIDTIFISAFYLFLFFCDVFGRYNFENVETHWGT